MSGVIDPSTGPDAADGPEVATAGPVRVVGTGLLGASVGMGLRALGVDVVLEDPSRTAVLLARDVGAGRLPEPDEPPARLVVVAAPPDVTADVVRRQLDEHPSAMVTDVAGVKSSVLRALETAGTDLRRYVGSHPMAGSERSGPTAARSDLFVGRPWVVVGSASSGTDALRAVQDLALDLGATPLRLAASAHDEAVALVSHVPQIAASLVAARLRDAEPSALELAGQGLRDVTRVAASDPAMWTSILAANAAPVAAVLRALRGDLDELLAALDRVAGSDAASAGTLGTVAGTIAAGNEGVGRIPGKHGGAQRAYDVVVVLVPDAPGELARLLADVGDAGINLEELSIEHAPRQAVGLASLSVLRGLRERLESALAERGWRLAG